MFRVQEGVIWCILCSLFLDWGGHHSLLLMGNTDRPCFCITISPWDVRNIKIHSLNTMQYWQTVGSFFNIYLYSLRIELSHILLLAKYSCSKYTEKCLAMMLVCLDGTGWGHSVQVTSLSHSERGAFLFGVSCWELLLTPL